MPREVLEIPLSSSVPGISRVVPMVRYGAGDARPKAYIHAALHADETPGMLVAHHLVRQLDKADARGEITGQVVVVPCANPIGLAQYVNGDQLGRYELAGGANFNRGWPDLFEFVSERVENRLGDDADANAAIVRGAMREALEAESAIRELESLRLVLAREACDADLVIDLHCDDEGLMHLFAVESLEPAAAELARELRCRAVLVSGDSRGGTFSESMALPWNRLRGRFPDRPFATVCVAATVELRGFADVSDELAGGDAAALFRVLQRRGHLHGDAGPLPESCCKTAPFDACDIARAPIGGVISYRVELGQAVSCGETIAEIVDPLAVDSGVARQPVRAAADGFVLSRRLRKQVRAGDAVAKIAGDEPLAHRRGYLLED